MIWSKMGWSGEERKIIENLTLLMLMVWQQHQPRQVYDDEGLKKIK